MAHFALLDENNIVIDVLAGRQEDDGKEDELSARTGQIYKQTSYNTFGGVHYTAGTPSTNQAKALRYNFAGLGYIYDSVKDAFIPPKPFDSWELDETTCLWVSPVAMPTDGRPYDWDEDTLSWIEIQGE